MKILATDLDRTLIPNGHWEADESAIPLFNELTEKHDPLVVDKWFTVQAMSRAEDSVERVIGELSCQLSP